MKMYFFSEFWYFFSLKNREKFQKKVKIPKENNNEAGVSGKGFLAPGNGKGFPSREIENHIPVLREGNGN